MARREGGGLRWAWGERVPQGRSAPTLRNPASISSTAFGKRTRISCQFTAVAGQKDRCWMKNRIPFDLPIAGRRKIGSRRMMTMFTARNVRGICRGTWIPALPYVQSSVQGPSWRLAKSCLGVFVSQSVSMFFFSSSINMHVNSKLRKPRICI